MKLSRYERAIRRQATRAGKDPDRALAAAKGAVTRSAKRRGVDPARSWNAKKGAFTKASARDTAARVHGQVARERTERRLTPAEKGARTRKANRLEAAAQSLSHAKRQPRADDLDFDGYDGDWEYFEVETSPDYFMGD